MAEKVVFLIDPPLKQMRFAAAIQANRKWCSSRNLHLIIRFAGLANAAGACAADINLQASSIIEYHLAIAKLISNLHANKKPQVCAIIHQNSIQSQIQLAIANNS